MEPLAIDQVRLNFNPQGLMAINAAIGLMMLGVSLDLKLDDFKRILVSPKAPCIGLIAQFILLPAFTFLLILVLKPHPSMALGMILVAACPGGNLSNIMTYLAKGNCAVSISMTAISTVAAIVMTPLNLSIWGSLNPATADILRRVSLSPVDVFITVFVILGIPLILGQMLARFFPHPGRPGAPPLQDLFPGLFHPDCRWCIGGQLEQFHQLCGHRHVCGVSAQCPGIESGILVRSVGQAGRAGCTRHLHRGGHSEFGSGTGAGFQFLRRCGRHGHSRGLVGGVAYYRRPDHGVYLHPSPAAWR